MLLSEMLDDKNKKAKKHKVIKVKYIRTMLSGGDCYSTLNDKRTYLFVNGNWYTPFGENPLTYEFEIVE